MKIYIAIENKTKEEAEEEFRTSSMLQFKEKLAKSIITRICPIGDKVIAWCIYINNYRLSFSLKIEDRLLKS